MQRITKTWRKIGKQKLDPRYLYYLIALILMVNDRIKEPALALLKLPSSILTTTFDFNAISTTALDVLPPLLTSTGVLLFIYLTWKNVKKQFNDLKTQITNQLIENTQKEIAPLLEKILSELEITNIEIGSLPPPDLKNPTNVRTGNPAPITATYRCQDDPLLYVDMVKGTAAPPHIDHDNRAATTRWIHLEYLPRNEYLKATHNGVVYRTEPAIRGRNYELNHSFMSRIMSAIMRDHKQDEPMPLPYTLIRGVEDDNLETMRPLVDYYLNICQNQGYLTYSKNGHRNPPTITLTEKGFMAYFNA